VKRNGSSAKKSSPDSAPDGVRLLCWANEAACAALGRKLEMAKQTTFCRRVEDAERRIAGGNGFYVFITDMSVSQTAGAGLLAAAKRLHPHASHMALVAHKKDAQLVHGLGFDDVVPLGAATADLNRRVQRLVLLSHLKRTREALLVSISGIQTVIEDLAGNGKHPAGLPANWRTLPTKSLLKAMMQLYEKCIIEICIKTHPGNLKQCAFLLGISYSSFLRRVSRYGLKPRRF
jgi:DNA-binding NtrC family response regulator